MDRRLAAIAGGVLAAAGALGMMSRRHVGTSETPTTTDLDAPLVDVASPDEPGKPSEPFYVATGWMPGRSFEIDQMAVGPVSQSAALPSVTYSMPTTPPAPPPLGDRLVELVSSYGIPADKRLVLTLSLRAIGDAIDAGDLEEGTAVVDFDWSPGAGLLMNLAIAVIATSGYVRINVCDLDGNLRAPELDVHIRGDDMRVLPDTTARTVDLDERRSEAAVTSQKLKAIREGVRIHPGSAASVLTRCRIVGSPFTS